VPCGQGLISATSSKKISQIRSLCTESTWDLNYPVLLRLISTNCHQIVDSSRGKENYPLQTNTLWVSLVQMFVLINHRIIKHHTKIIIDHQPLVPFVHVYCYRPGLLGFVSMLPRRERWSMPLKYLSLISLHHLCPPWCHDTPRVVAGVSGAPLAFLAKLSAAAVHDVTTPGMMTTWWHDKSRNKT